jgi:hypothetical protein
MPHGTPDWGEYAIQETIPKGFDQHELAVRLGSICAWSRTGTVYYAEDFAGGIYRWERVADSPNYITASRYGSIFSPWSCKFHMEKTPAKAVRLQKKFPLFVDSPVGFEIFPLFAGAVCTLSIQAKIYYNGKEYNYALQIDLINNGLKIMNGSPGYVTLYSPLNLIDQDMFVHSFKMVMDFKAGKYKYAKLDDKVFDLSVYNPYIVSTSNNNAATYYILGTQPDNQSYNIWIGGVIITQNE